MKFTALTTLLALALGAVATPENLADRDNNMNLEARAPCPNGPSLNACNELCGGVVSRACAACTTGACKTACQHGARMRKCLDCCDSRCVTC